MHVHNHQHVGPCMKISQPMRAHACIMHVRGSSLASSPPTSPLPPPPMGPSALTNTEAVSVSGGWGRHALSISAIAAVQLPWQSMSVDTTPPLMMPGKAQYFDESVTCASRPLGMRLLRKCRPSGWDGPERAGRRGKGGAVNTCIAGLSALQRHKPAIAGRNMSAWRKERAWHMDVRGCL